jgi:hypothetical protein
MHEGGRVQGRKDEGRKKGRKVTEKDRELWKDTHKCEAGHGRAY